MFWQFDCSYIKSQWHVWSKGLLHNCFFQNGVQLDSISMVWHFEISTYEIHSHGKNYQHFKKNSKPCTMLHMKRKLSLYFQPNSPSLFSINIFHQFHFPSVHSFIHPSIHPPIHLFKQLSLLELHLSAYCTFIYINCKITCSKNKIQEKHH